MSQDQRFSGDSQMELLREELAFYEKDGIILKLNGMPSNAQTIAKACTIAEEGSYMRDYVENENGRLIQLGFDWIQEK